MTREDFADAYLMELAHQLKEDFGIQHATVQVETVPNSPCDIQGLENADSEASTGER
jgi:hypothetical protein